MTMNTKLLVIGLDSFDSSLARQWTDEGRLPHLTAFESRAVAAPVHNPPGFESGSVWASFAFGADPGRHGFHDHVRRFDSASYETSVHDPADNPATAIWDRLEAAGKRAIVIDAVVPPNLRTPNGIRVIDWAAHAPSDGTATLKLKTWPPALRETIERDYGADPLGGKMCDSHRPRSSEEQAGFRDALVRRVAMKTSLLKDLIAREPWDFCFASYSEAHCAGHHCWHLNDPGHEEHYPAVAAAVGNPLRDVYEALDRAVGDIVAHAGDDVGVMIFMSHGIETGYTGVRLLDRILARLDGELNETRNASLSTARQVWRSLPQPMRRLLSPARARFAQSVYREGFLPHRERRLCFEVFCNERTSGIRINLAGREAHGIVQPGAEFDALCARLKRQLLDIHNEETGEPLVLDVVRTSDAYEGAGIAQLPDLLVTWNRAAPIRRVWSAELGRMHHPHPSIRTGDHRPDGLLLASMPNATARRLNAPINVIDLAPSIAALFNVETVGFQGRTLDALTGGP